MAECPVGILVDVSADSDTVPQQNSKRTLEDLLSELGVKYSLSSGSSTSTLLRPIKWKNSKKQAREVSSPLISEDDFIGNEVFDFKEPSLEQLELRNCSESQQTSESDVQHLGSVDTYEPTFEFPVLSVEPSFANADWNTEVTVEAKKISKRLSMMTELPVLNLDPVTSSESSGCFGDKTFTPVSSAKSSDGDDSVFCTPRVKRTSKFASKGKENTPNVVFVPNPNPVEALTPEGVRKIKGPLLRRGTFTLDKVVGTPRTRTTQFSQVPKQFGQEITQSPAININARSNYLLKTPDNVSRTSLTRRETSQQRRSSSLSRFEKGDLNSSITKSAHLGPPKSNPRRASSVGRTPTLAESNISVKSSRLGPSTVIGNVGGPSPLLRRALAPKAIGKPNQGVASSCSVSRGPLKVFATRLGKEFQPVISKHVTATGTRILQPRNQIV